MQERFQPTRSKTFRACARIRPFILPLQFALILAFAHAIPAQTDAKLSKNCLTSGCHELTGFGSEPMHVPYLEGQCQACHEDHASTNKNLLRPGGDALCLACHTKLELNETRDALKHGAEGNACLDCHTPHQGRVRGRLRAEEKLLGCANCHGNFLADAAKQPFKHNYFDPQRACGECHYAHQRSEHHYLRENVGQSCLTCHDMAIATKEGPLANVAEQMKSAKNKHGALNRGSCPTCHTPHGSAQPALLVSGYPAGGYAPYKTEDYALCWRCHDSKLVEQADASGITKFANAGKNLHRVHVVEMKKGRACHLCHEAHVSAEAHLLRTEIVFQSWKAPLGWKPAPDGGGTCATACHRERPYKP